MIEVNTAVGKFSAAGLFRVGTYSTPAGALSRIGLSAAATGAGATTAAAIFLDAIAGGLSQVGVVGDRFFVTDGSSKFAPFVIEGGVVYINTAFIKTASIDGAKRFPLEIAA